MRIAIGILVILVTAPAAAETPVERGAYLVEAVMGCAACHSPRGEAAKTQPLSGGPRAIETDAHTVYAGNITPDRETGIGAWSDAQIRAAIADGIGADGRRLAPEMPSAFYRGLTDADLDAVVAYLRSVPAVDNRMPAPVYHTEVEPEAWPTATPPDDGKVPDEPAARGAYLANAAYCMNCHGRGADARFDSAAPGHGGLVMRGPWGAVAVADITGAALAGWTDAEIDRALSQGVDRNGESFIPPMNRARFYSKMTPNDRAALITWLRKL